MDAQPTVFEVDLATFQGDVVARSQETPVVLLFWADQIPPAAEAKRTLEALARQYQGKFALALCDVARMPQLAQQLRVQGVPSIRVIVDGQIADQLDGPQGEAVLRQLIDGLTLSDGDRLQAQLEEHLAARDWNGALAILEQALKAEPNNAAFKLEWADILARKGDLKGAATVLATVPEDTPERERPVARLELATEAADMNQRKARARLTKDPADLDARYQAAVTLAVAGDDAEALDHCMEILRQDRNFRDDAGRTTMIKIMATMGKGSELAKRYRRRMFAFLH